MEASVAELVEKSVISQLERRSEIVSDKANRYVPSVSVSILCIEGIFHECTGFIEFIKRVGEK